MHDRALNGEGTLSAGPTPTEEDLHGKGAPNGQGTLESPSSEAANGALAEAGQEPQIATFSLARTMSAICLLGVLGGIAVLKPFPQGVHASDVRYIDPPTQSASGDVPVTNTVTRATMTIQDGSGRFVRSELASGEVEAWRSLGELIGPKFTVRIELLGDETLYTLLDHAGQPLATRMTRAQLASLYPTLDLDSLTASSENLRLMMATERTGD